MLLSLLTFHNSVVNSTHISKVTEITTLVDVLAAAGDAAGVFYSSGETTASLPHCADVQFHS